MKLLNKSFKFHFFFQSYWQKFNFPQVYYHNLNTIKKNERFVLIFKIYLLFHLPPLLYSQVRTIFSLDYSFRWLSKFKTFFHCWSSPRICTVCVSPFVQRTIGRYYRRQKRETNQRASGSGATDGPPFQIFVSTSPSCVSYYAWFLNFATNR